MFIELCVESVFEQSDGEMGEMGEGDATLVERVEFWVAENFELMPLLRCS